MENFTSGPSLGGAPSNGMASQAPAKKPKKLSDGDAADIVKEVRERIEQAWEHERVNMAEAVTDQRFLANDQWPDASRRQREIDGRPVLTFNRLATFVHQVVNPIRQADKSIKAKPDDDTTDPTLSRVIDGLFRKIQKQSMAHSVYAHALICQAGCGIGWVRVKHDFKDDKSFDQEIFLEKVDNPLSVYWDPAARDPVKSDAMWMAVTEMVPEATFKERWPDNSLWGVDDPNWGGIYGVSQSGFYWRDDRDIRVAEYYRKVPDVRRLAKLYNGQIIDITGVKKGQLATMMIQAERTVNSYKVEKYLVSGVEVLEGPTEVPGIHIPLVPAIGGEIALDRGVYRYGVIRFSRDGQIMYNLNRTAMAEWIGNSPKAPWLVTQKMIAQHRGIWETQSQQNRNFLPYTPDKDAPQGPQRSQPPEAPVALIQDASQAADDMKYGANIHDASLGANKSAEVSGVALRAKQMEGDVSNYHFADNFNATLQHIGTIMMSWVPVIYDTPRTVLLVAEDGTEHPTPVNTPQMDPQTGQMTLINDLTQAKFAVEVDIGPSYSTRRQEAAQEIGEFMHALPPQQAALISDIFARNQDWEGSDEIADRLKATVPPQIIQATVKGPDGQPVPPPQPPPDPMMLQQLQKITAEIEKIRADAALSIMKAREVDHNVNVAQLPGLMDQPQPTGQPRMPGPMGPGPQGMPAPNAPAPPGLQ